VWLDAANALFAIPDSLPDEVLAGQTAPPQRVSDSVQVFHKPIAIDSKHAVVIARACSALTAAAMLPTAVRGTWSWRRGMRPIATAKLFGATHCADTDPPR